MPVGTPAIAPGQTSPVTGRVATAATPEAWGGVLPITPNTPNPVPPGTNASTRTFALHLSSVQCRPFQFRASGDPGQRGHADPAHHEGPIRGQERVGAAQPVIRTTTSSPPGSPAVEGARVGWGGRIADLMLTANRNSIFTAISLSGNAVFLAGQSPWAPVDHRPGRWPWGHRRLHPVRHGAAPAILDAAIATQAPT